MGYAISNPTFVGTNIGASWLTDTTQAIQSCLESDPIAHRVTTSLFCAAVAVKDVDPFGRIATFVKCQIVANGLLLVPSFVQGVVVEPKFGTLLKTADTIYNNLATPLRTTKDYAISGATWLADKSYQLSSFVMTTLSPLVPSATITSMIKASRVPAAVTEVATSVATVAAKAGKGAVEAAAGGVSQKASSGLATRYVIAPMFAAIITNFIFTIPAIAKDLFGTSDLEGKSAFAQSVANLANAWTNTDRMIVDSTNYLVESAQSTWKRLRA